MPVLLCTQPCLHQQQPLLWCISCCSACVGLHLALPALTAAAACVAWLLQRLSCFCTEPCQRHLQPSWCSGCMGNWCALHAVVLAPSLVYNNRSPYCSSPATQLARKVLSHIAQLLEASCIVMCCAEGIDQQSVNAYITHIRGARVHCLCKVKGLN